MANSTETMTDIFQTYNIDAIALEVQGGSPPVRGKSGENMEFAIFVDEMHSATRNSVGQRLIPH